MEFVRQKKVNKMLSEVCQGQTFKKVGSTFPDEIFLKTSGVNNAFVYVHLSTGLLTFIERNDNFAVELVSTKVLVEE